MSWNPVLVGIDTSKEALGAARCGAAFADRAGTQCYLAHAITNAWSTAGESAAMEEAAQFNEALVAEASKQIEFQVRDIREEVEDLRIEVGRAPVVLRSLAEEYRAGLVVLGGKHHSRLARWLSGSTTHHVVRTLDVPVLVTASEECAFKRVLVAVDLSYAAVPTLETAERVARLFDADLKVLHVVEPLPPVPELPAPMNPEEFFKSQSEGFDECVWSSVKYDRSEKQVRQGPVATVVGEEFAGWSADLLVLGSHGKGWVDRILMGSTTERILNHLPGTTLVVPVPAPSESQGSPGGTEAKGN